MCEKCSTCYQSLCPLCLEIVSEIWTIEIYTSFTDWYSRTCIKLYGSGTVHNRTWAEAPSMLTIIWRFTILWNSPSSLKATIFLPRLITEIALDSFRVDMDVYFATIACNRQDKIKYVFLAKCDVNHKMKRYIMIQEVRNLYIVYVSCQNSPG